MKKLVLAAIIVLVTIGLSNAQEVKFGAKAGVNFSSIGGDQTNNVEGRTSFHIGGLVEIMISDKFYFQPELLYSEQGFNNDFSLADLTAENEIKLSYLNIPLMAKYYVSDGLSIEVGPQIGVLLSADVEFNSTTTFGGVTEVNSGNEDIKDNINSIDYGVGVGVGYKMDSGLNFAIRYNLGLSNINDFEGSDDVKQQNSVIQVSVGYFFN